MTLPVRQNDSEGTEAVARMSRRLRALEDVVAVTREVMGSHELDHVLRVALEKLMSWMDAEGGSILLAEPDRSMRFAIATGPGAEDLQDVRIPQGEGIAGWVVTHRRPLAVADVARDPRFCAEPDARTGFQTRSVLACPLTVRDQIIGVAELVNKRGGPFTRDDRICLEAVAFPIAAAIENARVHESLQRSQELVMEHSRTLEARVWERTAELRAANRRYAEANRRLREAKDQMVHAEKMASIGSIAAGVAHEINNPIGFVGSNLKTLGNYVRDIKEVLMECRRGLSGEALARRWEEADLDFMFEDLDNLMAESRDGIQRVVGIVRDLKQFSHSDRGALEETDLNECLGAALTLLSNELKYSAQVETHFADLPKIQAYASLLTQVFVNLIINAVHALDDEGRILLQTSQMDDFVEVTITDNGCGMTPEVQARIFDPFFTTKEVGKGTGLGLAISYEIVQRHLGEMRLQSAPGEGTTFTIRIPVDLDERLVSHAEGETPEAAGETV